MINLKINPKKEMERIVQFIKTTLKKQGFKKIIISLSGGIDSATVLYLVRKALATENILIVNFPYLKDHCLNIEIVKQQDIPEKNIFIVPIKDIVDCFKTQLKIEEKSYCNKIRIGNIVARIRMIILYDLAKKNNALVCGTENRSEYYLGYFTRFGDQASDLEPINHLFKTQVYSLAKYLVIPQKIIDQRPSAGLWTGQTDEGELGFTYQEADPVIHLYYDKKFPIEKIKKLGLKNVDKIVAYCKKNEFKHKVPYHLTQYDYL